MVQLAAQQTIDPYSVPLDEIDIANPDLFQQRQHWGFFERLRKEAPVHYCPKAQDEDIGAYWSVTRYQDIMAVDTNHKAFSSEPIIVLQTLRDNFQPEMFIAMDQPKHDEQRKVVSPGVAPDHLRDNFEPLIRQRVAKVLDDLPVGETFNWVDLVSIEITTQMLATLFDFPFEDRRKLTWWSDLSTMDRDNNEYGLTEDQINAELFECLEVFSKLLAERKAKPPARDFISLMAHHPTMSQQEPLELLGNLMLLIVGGNDTTRNSMSGSVLALNEFPAEYDKLRANPGLITNMVSETIRWQTPLAYMARRALTDVELGGQTIKKGDKVAMWYVSGNRDETAIDRANEYLIDRDNARRHISFGFGIHRCMGNRLADMQIRILWEEIMKRFDKVEVVGDPSFAYSVFVHGITDLPVVVHPK